MTSPNAFERLRPVVPLPLPRAGEGRGEGVRPARARRVNLAPRAGSFHIADAEKSRAQALRTEQIRRGTISVRPPKAQTPPGNDLPGVPRAAGRLVHTDAPAQASNALQAVFAAAPDLAMYLRLHAVTEVMAALDVSRRTAWRLQHGYWPADARKLLAAWAAHKGRVAPAQSRWFLRRVDARGAIAHAAGAWSAPLLATRAGQTVAVARVDGQRLLAQTLDLPAQRFVLTALQGDQHA